jgi:hypothetical protein
MDVVMRYVDFVRSASDGASFTVDWSAEKILIGIIFMAFTT